MTQMHHIKSEYQFDGLEEFAYIVTHEIRNASRALTEIPLWICEDLSADGQSISAETAENLDLLVRHSKRLDQMLKDLLAYSEVGRGSSPEPVKLETLVEDALAATDLPPGFKVELEGLSGEVLLPSEEAPRLARIAIQNAVQHGPPSGGQLRISSRIQEGSVSLIFQDNGPGVPEDQITTIFRPMRSCRRKDETGASSMGLAIAQKIVTQNGGKILAGESQDLGGFHLEMQFPERRQTGASLR